MAAGKGRLAPKKGVSRPKTGASRDPVVKVRAVKELPASRPPSHRSMRYADAMAEVRAKGKRGGWHQIATFETGDGATIVRRRIMAGERPVDGKVADWDIEARRLRDDDGTVIGSGLYVKLR